MEAARLMAILEMDDKSFLAAVDRAKQKTGGFEAQLSGAKSGLSQASRAMMLLSRVTGESVGPLGRAGGAVTGLVMAFATNPVYAVIAAVSMLIGLLTTGYAKAMDAALEKTKAQAKAEGELGDAIRKRLELSAPQKDVAKKEAEKAAEAGRGGNLHKLEKLRDKKNREAEEAGFKMKNFENLAASLGGQDDPRFQGRREKLREEYATAVESARAVNEVYEKAVKDRQNKSQKAMTAMITAQMEAEGTAEGEAERKKKERQEKSQKAMTAMITAQMESEEKAEKEKEERAKKETKIRLDGEQAVAAARAGEGVSLKDWDTNSITKQGGTLTHYFAGINPSLRAVDRQAQISEKILEEQRKTTRAIEALGE